MPVQHLKVISANMNYKLDAGSHNYLLEMDIGTAGRFGLPPPEQEEYFGFSLRNVTKLSCWPDLSFMPGGLTQIDPVFHTSPACRPNQLDCQFAVDLAI